MPPRSYFWTDTPDGEDILKKMNVMSKFAAMGGLGLVCWDVVVNPQPHLKGYAFRAAACLVPPLGAVAAFTLTSQSLCKHVPQLDPRFSYSLGAVAASAVIGGASRSPRMGAILAFYSSISAYFLRDAMEEKEPGGFWGLWPQPLNNDDELMAADIGFAPRFGSLPLPAARPAKSPSDFRV